MGRKRKIIKSISVAFLCITVLITSLVPLMNAQAAVNFDYPLAFKDSILFYDANKCGKEAAVNNVFSWRYGPCHTTDGSDVGLDLTGGYHDAGDHVKFGLPQGYTASVLGWSLYEFRDVFDSTNNTVKMLQQLKYFTDYFLKSHPDAGTFYYQCGEGDLDHQYWGAPELQTGERPTLFKADASNPASDIVGESSAALALMYLNYKSTDAAYADRCLKAAKEIYAIGKTKLSVGSYQYFYQSTSAGDDMAWGAVWLYIATKDEQYLADAKQFAVQKNSMSEDPLKNKWTMCWDNMYLPAHLKLAELTGDVQFKASIDFNLDYWLNTLERTPAGLCYLHYWGVTRYAAAASMLALIYNKIWPDKKYVDFAQSQIDYILGKNPAGMSYEIGFGTKWSAYVHHRAAQGGQGYADNADKTPAKYVLTGALIGGPDKTDTFKESVNEYQYTEVALDYNAGFVGALAGAVKYFGVVIPSTSPSTSPSSTPTVKPSPSGTGYKISGYIAPDFKVPGTSTQNLKKDFKVELVNSGFSVLTDENGYFEFNNVPTNTSGHTLKISKPNYLYREVKNVKVASSNVQISTQAAPVLLWAGDLVQSGIQDNAINMTDIMGIAGAFNGVPGDARYSADSDLNRDNAINMNDIMIIAGHFNTTTSSYPAVVF